MEKIISCQISFIPIQTSDYIEDVNQVLEIIKKSELDTVVGQMSTTVTGTPEAIFTLVKDIFLAKQSDCKFSMTVTYSNVCGCEI